MKLEKMFVKPITREINGVITMDYQEDRLAQELQEYVVTKELLKHFRDFYDAYQKGLDGTTNQIGVWISGFFGSGKSHFLKMLACLLNSEKVKGKTAFNYFQEDNKIADQMVLANMQKAVNTSTDVIAFNIDALGTSGVRGKEDIVRVFLRAFNEKLGYFGSSPKIASFERMLDQEGRLGAFKQEYEKCTGKKWEDDRKHISLARKKQFSEVVKKMEIWDQPQIDGWYSNAMGTDVISVTDFVNLVNDYIMTKGKNHHVVFCVDEVGQYIGDNSQLMLGLQTLVEKFGDVCKGKVWVIVTSQQALEASNKEIKNDDFSKIAGRFPTRLSLTSTNVDEVIKIRVLQKTESAKNELSLQYENFATVIKNIIHFSGSKVRKLYDNSKDYASIYPLVGYQFELLVDILTAIRQHSSSGKSMSDGARSMLALCKEAVQRIKDSETGELVPLYFFYDCLEPQLDHNHSGVISKALQDKSINQFPTENCFTVNVLKVLFLLKYVNGFVTDAESIVSLMVDNVEVDRVKLKNQVEESLKILVEQNYVQCYKDIYTFLTDDEQAIRNAITKTNVDSTQVLTDEVAKVIFEEIIKTKKYIYPALGNRYAFWYSQKIDEHRWGSAVDYPMTLEILTPWAQNRDNHYLMMNSQSSVCVRLPEDAAFLNEYMEIAKTTKFLRVNSDDFNANQRAIITRVGEELKEHKKHAENLLREALSKAEIFTCCQQCSETTGEIVGRINSAFNNLCANVYPKLNYITKGYGEAEVLTVLKDSGEIALDFGAKQYPNQNALDDVFSQIEAESRKHAKTGLMSIKDKFSKEPYGFISDDIHWILACLFKQGKISMWVNGTEVNFAQKSPEELKDYIVKKQYQNSVMFDVRTGIDKKKIRVVENILKDLFECPTHNESEDSLMQIFREKAQKKETELANLAGKYDGNNYPGKNVVDNGLQYLKAIEYLSVKKFFDTVSRLETEFNDFGEDFDAVKNFFNGTGKKVYDSGCKCLEIFKLSEGAILPSAHICEIAEKIEEILKLESPYSRLHEVNDLVEKFNSEYKNLVDQKVEEAHKKISEFEKDIMTILANKTWEHQEMGKKVSEEFEHFKHEVQDESKKIYEIRNVIDKCGQVVQLYKEQIANKDKEEHQENKIFAIHIKELQGQEWRLHNEQDLDKHLKALKEEILKKMQGLDELQIKF